MEDFKGLAVKANYTPISNELVNPPAFKKAVEGIEQKLQNYPPSPFTAAQSNASPETKSQENSAPSLTPPTTKEATPEKIEPEKSKFSIRGVLTGLSYHFDGNGHANYDHGGTFDHTKSVLNPNDGLYYSPYIPNNQPYNEFNPGGLVGVSVDRSNNYTKGFNFDPRDAELFAGGYKNSYSDPAIVGGVNYTPFNFKIETKQLGTFLAKLGVSAGMAYTTNGTYRHDGPTIGRDFTFLATGLGIIENKETGLGLQFNLVPPVINDGMVSTALSYRFKSFMGL